MHDDLDLSTLGASGVESRPPVDDPTRPMPRPAQEILRAARRLLLEGGFDALRLDAIVREAGKNKSAVKYYFGNKDGLIMAVTESLDHDKCMALAARARAARGEEERLRCYIEGQKELIVDEDSFLVFFDLLPHILRDERLRSKLAAVYPWYRQIGLERLGLSDKVTDENKEELEAFAALMTAIADGLALQYLLRPPGFDVDRCLGVLRQILSQCMDEPGDESD